VRGRYGGRIAFGGADSLPITKTSRATSRSKWVRPSHTQGYHANPPVLPRAYPWAPTIQIPGRVLPTVLPPPRCPPRRCPPVSCSYQPPLQDSHHPPPQISFLPAGRHPAAHLHTAPRGRTHTLPHTRHHPGQLAPAVLPHVGVGAPHDGGRPYSALIRQTCEPALAAQCFGTDLRQSRH